MQNVSVHIQIQSKTEQILSICSDYKRKNDVKESNFIPYICRIRKFYTFEERNKFGDAGVEYRKYDWL